MLTVTQLQHFVEGARATHNVGTLAIESHMSEEKKYSFSTCKELNNELIVNL